MLRLSICPAFWIVFSCNRASFRWYYRVACDEGTRCSMHRILLFTSYGAEWSIRRILLFVSYTSCSIHRIVHVRILCVWIPPVGYGFRLGHEPYRHVLRKISISFMNSMTLLMVPRRRRSYRRSSSVHGSGSGYMSPWIQLPIMSGLK